MKRLSLVSAALVCAPAFAEEPSASDLVVTASRTSLGADDSPYSNQSIAEAELAGRASVADALAQLADIYVQSPGGRAGASAIFLRGADPNFTTVLLDGVPLNNPGNNLGGSVNVAEIAPAGIERIEIVAGPASSLYGSGALAGVINLVVPGGGDDHALDAQMALGTELDPSAFLRWRGPLGGDYGASLAVSYDDAGDSAAPASFRSRSILGKLAARGDADSRLVLRLATADARAFPDSSGGERFAVIRELERRDSREALVGVSHPVVRTGDFRLTLGGSYLDRRDTILSPGVAPSDFALIGVPGGTDETRYRRAAGHGVARYDSNGWQAVAGIEAQRETARSEGALDFFGMVVPSGFKGERSTWSGFAEASRTAARWTANAGIRVDSIDGLGTHVTGRAGFRYAVTESGLSLLAAAGTGFKAPSFYALGNPFVGNPDLGPERSRGVELGIDWAGARGERASLTAFHSRFAGLIDFVPDPVPRLENRSAVISEGVSFSISAPLADAFTASVQVQYADTRDRDSGERLLNRPRWRSSAALIWSIGDALTLTGRANIVGERLSYSVPTGIARLPAYAALAVEGAWEPEQGFTVRLVAENLANGANMDAVGFEAPSRRARLVLGKAF